jgi:hypothetical protein
MVLSPSPQSRLRVEKLLVVKAGVAPGPRQRGIPALLGSRHVDSSRRLVFRASVANTGRSVHRNLSSCGGQGLTPGIRDPHVDELNCLTVRLNGFWLFRREADTDKVGCSESAPDEISKSRQPPGRSPSGWQHTKKNGPSLVSGDQVETTSD